MRLLTAEDLGNLVHQARTTQKMTQPALAGACGVGVRFIVDLEKGKPTCELGKALTVAAMLGVRLSATLPSETDA